MKISVLIPYRPTDEHRARAFAWVLVRWATVEAEVVTGGDHAGPWRKAAAVNDCLARASGDVLVISDADVWCDSTLEATLRVMAGAPWVVPHRSVRRLSSRATEAVLDGIDPELAVRMASGYGYDRPIYDGIEGGGIVVLARETYEACPIDDRFAGWGGEDEAWGTALRTLYGPPVRLKAPLWHLWHPPAPRLSRSVGSLANNGLRRLYFKASKNPDDMRELLLGAVETTAERQLKVG